MAGIDPFISLRSTLLKNECVQVDIDSSPGQEVDVVPSVKPLTRNSMPPPSADWTNQFSPSGVVSVAVEIFVQRSIVWLSLERNLLL